MFFKSFQLLTATTETADNTLAVNTVSQYIFYNVLIKIKGEKHSKKSM